MGFYTKYLLPKGVHFICGTKRFMSQRKKIVALAEGRVLEVGIGSGLNLPLYDSAKVNHVWGLDPSNELWALAEKTAARVKLNVEFIKGRAEAIPLIDRSADTVLVTYSLCSVRSILPALREMRRILKPAGHLIFCEHGQAPDAAVRKWQNRLNPIWKRIAGGCNLNLPIPFLLEQAGFKIRKMDSMYLPGWKPATFNYWGTAVSAK
jgi:ubiquinone/menaquinone biosynthesis C-methylase UbiE